MTLLMVALGAAVGAPSRYLIDRSIQARQESAFPWGTLSVNIVASLILGIVTGAGRRVDPALATLIGTGFCGALSTFSTFSFETLRLVQEGERFHAAANVAVTLAAGMVAAALGWFAGQALG